ncbi:helix-turn-helix domain-containing protein [Orenia metallireducens]|uniref:helix-turn-helix domain-containing protein n=1 Tax=Orenia metallireducens TaxID=1413210 RepID=UPI0015E5B4EE|nr:helix-turn-helix domain-containing protein [Orenia metallireducens]
MKVYDVTEVAEILKVTERTVRKMLNEGELQGKKVARSWRVTENQLKRYLEGKSMLDTLAKAFCQDLREDLREEFKKEVNEGLKKYGYDPVNWD